MLTIEKAKRNIGDARWILPHLGHSVDAIDLFILPSNMLDFMSSSNMLDFITKVTDLLK